MATPPRSRRPLRGDLRLLVGVVLVVVSVAGVWLIVTAADRATPVLRAARTITPGEPVRSEDLQVVDVGLGVLEGEYLRPGDLRAGQVASRTLPEGEMVPRSALIDESHVHTTTIVVESSTGIPASVGAGTEIEIWAAPPLEDGRSYDVPRLLVDDVVVRSVLEPEGMLADTIAQAEVVVDRDDVADLLAAVTGGSALS
jgi:hypothetical protein